MALRFSIQDFSLANPFLKAATITFWTVSGSGAKTTTKATLYDAVTGTGTLTNPQVLDSDGKFAAPVYIETAIIATISDTTAPDHDTGIIHTPGSWKGNWVTATVYYAGEYVKAGSNADSTDNIYVVDETHTSGTFATDVSGGQLSLAVDVANILFGASAGIRWNFDTSTSMADPGSGDIRFNNATISSVTAIAVSKDSAATGTPDVSDYVAIWDDSTSTVKGILIIREIGTPANFAIFTLSAVTDNTAWLEVTVSHESGPGGFAAADKLAVDFYRTGDVGLPGDMDGANNLSELTNAGTARTNLGLVIGTDVQSHDADLDSLAALTGVAGQYLGYGPSGDPAVVRGIFSNNGYETNRYYGGMDQAVSINQTIVVTADRMYGRIFLVQEPTTFTRIGIEITALAGTNARLGIYNWNGTVASRSLVVDAGTVLTSSNAVVEATISETLMPGPYILAVVFDNTPTTRSSNNVGGGVLAEGGFLGAAVPGDGNTQGGFYTAHTFAALPTPFGALTYVSGAQGTLPTIWLRVV